MVLRCSISNTRKFLRKTIDNFKSFFSNNGTYHKLQKTPNKNHHHHPSSTISTSSSSSIHKDFQSKHRDSANRSLTLDPRREERDETLFSKPKVDFVCGKLKEMEKMMNNGIVSDEHYMSDVREFLHCYSRLRYAAYLNVVEKFFMDVYFDFFSPHSEYSRASVGTRRSTVVGVGSFDGNKHQRKCSR